MSSEVKSANGAAVVFNSTDVAVAYGSAGTTISHTSNTNPVIYVPITNPVSPDYKLDTVRIDFVGGGVGSAKPGMVTDFKVYYGSNLICDTGSDFTYTSTWTQTVVNAAKIADSSSYGMLLTLNLNLQDTGSYIILNSVDLTFVK